MSSKCTKPAPINSDTTPNEMEMLSFEFTGDYTDMWNKVDSLQNIGLYKSALEIVAVIYENAQKEKNTPQVVKSVIHKMKFNSYIEEEDYVLAINDLGSIWKNADYPLKQIIHSVIAETYWGYYQINRWKFINRSQTINFDNSDIRTWDLNTLADKVIKHYLLSLSNKDSLQHTSVIDFEEMLVTSKEDQEQRPTLYDFLANRALNFFHNEESNLTRPADQFVLKGQNYFGSAQDFSLINISSEDTLSNQLYYIGILQELTRFHLNDENPAALIDVELTRLEFAKNNSTETNRSDLYLKALKLLAQKYENHEAFAEIQNYIAIELNSLGQQYSIQNSEFKWKKKEAYEACLLGMKKFPDSYGALLCESLKLQIENKNLSISAENAVSPNEYGKFLLSSANLDTIYFRIVKVDWDFFMEETLYGEDLMKKLKSLSPQKSWSKTIKNEGDFQTHAREVKLEKLPLGNYILLASPDQNFKLENNGIAYASFWSSNLSYTERRNDDETYDITVIDRTSGEPISNVKAQLYIRKYSYTSRKYEIKKEEHYTSNENGQFTIKSPNDYRYLYIDLTYKDDQYNNTNQLYQYRPYNDVKKPYYTTTFFTDRAIYRPGQTIYFKGIRIYHDRENHTIQKGAISTVTLYDVNNQKVADVKLTTNEFGTFNGSFTAPIGVVNGYMSIRDAHGSKGFSVEEYKRPKFDVEFEPIKGVYKLNEIVNVKGKAKAFAGSSIDGAEVQYRVSRNANFPYWAWHRWGHYPYSAQIEITNGITKTDENGNFEIDFTALPDETIDPKYQPTYSYTVSADVTDINGETHSSSQWVMVGYNAMNLSLSINSIIEKTDPNKFKINTTNLNGQKVEASGTIKIKKLKEPQHAYRNRLWEKADIQEFTEEEYHHLFPEDLYDDENNVAKLSVEKEILTLSFNTAKEDSIQFSGMKNWAPGRYAIEAKSIDSFGTEVKDIKYITVYDKNSIKNATSEIWWFNDVKNYVQPGENAEFILASAMKNLKVLYEVEIRGEIVDKKWITLNQEQKSFSIPIEEKHRGNFTIHLSAVKNGRFYSYNHTVYVSYENKTLDIEFETFRNKLLPGQKEEWKLKIKGPKGEKVAAEMLATMYDASLDEFAGNSFYFNVFQSYYSNKYWSSNCFYQKYSNLYQNYWNPYKSVYYRKYDELNWYGYNVNYYWYGYRNSRAVAYNMQVSDVSGSSMDGEMEIEEAAESESTVSRLEGSKDEANAPMGGVDKGDGFATTIATGKEDQKNAESGEKDNRTRGSLGEIKARSNLNETAFFFPELRTNEKGEVIINFTIPEALTKWKFLGMAHTQDLKIGYIQDEVVTQKQLMVMPNAPRFFREGDKITFTAKVSNLAEKDLSGNAQLILFDAITMKPIDELFKNSNNLVDFTVKKGQSTPISWDIEIPSGVQAVTYRVVAKADNFTDGEEMALPILTNRMLVTESLPLPSKGVGTKNFTFTKLVNSGSSSSLKHHKLTLEYTSNPAWYAVQAMPYMMEYPYECSEQTFTRYYANSLASHIVNSSPKIKSVFDSWKQSSPEAFLSNLEKNHELKSLLLEETPWVLNAQDESERKKRIALLFDLNRMDNELSKAMKKLQKAQVSNGGWPWFPGMPESRHITQHIVTGMGHLDHLGVKNVRENNEIWQMVKKAIQYLDIRLEEDFNYVKKYYPSTYLKEQHLSELQIQYFYARSYFKDIPMSNKTKEAYDYYQDQAKKYWMNFNIYSEGMIALEAHRYGVESLPQQVLKSIKERSLLHEEMGMYWKDNIGGYYWYQAPIETQALLIEAFDEVTNDQKAVEEMKVWLLKQKQTTDWKTTKATAEACYALLLRGTDILMNDEIVEIKVDGKLIDPTKNGAKIEAGTGYFKTSWQGNDIKPEMGNITVTRKSDGVSWGAMYWQYFEDLDKITPHETPLKLDKNLFLVKNTASGPVISPITESTKLKPGDKIKVRVELRTDRDLEYVHMKDMRASAFEPINVFSRYKYQDGLGYYESTKDASTNFFMDYVRKGTYVFEYDLRASQYGDFSNGVTTIQCMYAPEFTSHSEGIRVKIEK